MSRQIVVVQGHPDPNPVHFNHALAEAYSQAAEVAGHNVTLIEVAKLDFPLLRNKQEFDEAPLPGCLQQPQTDIFAADHLVFFFPLWLGTMPAILKGFLEQVLRPPDPNDPMSLVQQLKGKSARIVVTMGMPVPLFRWYFGAHGLKSFEQSVLRFCGISTIRESLIGTVESSAPQRERWLAAMAKLGARGE
ncbi:MAG: hypothetical protein GEEBNDBF_00084 [bacterium]|nr:hypothetical protein [bacterium]